MGSRGSPSEVVAILNQAFEIMSAGPCWIQLCRINELPEHGALGFNLKGHGSDDLFIVRRGGVLRVYRNSCPHWPGSSMPWRKHAYLDSTGKFILCSGHGARFTIDDGVCIHGPCLGSTLEAIPLRVDDDHTIWIFV